MNPRRVIILCVFLIVTILCLLWAFTYGTGNILFITISVALIVVFGPAVIAATLSYLSKEYRSESVYDTSIGRTILSDIVQNEDSPPSEEIGESLANLLLTFKWYFAVAGVLILPFSVVLHDSGILSPLEHFDYLLSDPIFGIWTSDVVTLFTLISVGLFIVICKDELHKRIEHLLGLILLLIWGPFGFIIFLEIGLDTSSYEVAIFVVPYAIIAFGAGKYITGKRKSPLKGINVIVMIVLLLSSIMTVNEYLGGTLVAEQGHVIITLLSFIGLGDNTILLLIIAAFLAIWMLVNSHLSLTDYDRHHSRILFVVIAILIVSYCGVEIFRYIYPLIYNVTVMNPDNQFGRAIGYLAGGFIGLLIGRRE